MRGKSNERRATMSRTSIGENVWNSIPKNKAHFLHHFLHHITNLISSLFCIADWLHTRTKSRLILITHLKISHTNRSVAIGGSHVATGLSHIDTFSGDMDIGWSGCSVVLLRRIAFSCGGAEPHGDAKRSCETKKLCGLRLLIGEAAACQMRSAERSAGSKFAS